MVLIRCGLDSRRAALGRQRDADGPVPSDGLGAQLQERVDRGRPTESRDPAAASGSGSGQQNSPTARDLGRRTALPGCRRVRRRPARANSRSPWKMFPPGIPTAASTSSGDEMSTQGWPFTSRARQSSSGSARCNCRAPSAASAARSRPACGSARKNGSGVCRPKSVSVAPLNPFRIEGIGQGMAVDLTGQHGGQRTARGDRVRGLEVPQSLLQMHGAGEGDRRVDTRGQAGQPIQQQVDLDLGTGRQHRGPPEPAVDNRRCHSCQHMGCRPTCHQRRRPGR